MITNYLFSKTVLIISEHNGQLVAEWVPHNTKQVDEDREAENIGVMIDDL
jgi:hypothetical protein